MENGDRVVQTFDMRRLMKVTKLPLICVYKNPADYPNKYVARLWDVDKPTTLVAITDSFEEIRAAKPPEMVIMQRQPNDDPVIIETWI
ncbi:MAG: hypothetical protein PHE09_17035 [Oscillospiraceae bacterium]|nr:hypothetical protein [Oscillospiraceae bacterium]